MTSIQTLIKVAYADMSEFDKWALLRLEEVRQKGY